jgi:hypothetical protein
MSQIEQQGRKLYHLSIALELRMYGVEPPVPQMPSWHTAKLKKGQPYLCRLMH